MPVAESKRAKQIVPFDIELRTQNANHDLCDFSWVKIQMVVSKSILIPDEPI